MVRTSRRQTLLRTTLPPVEQAEPLGEATFDLSSQPADDADVQTADADADRQTAEAENDQEAKQQFDADRLLPVLIQEMDLPQEAKDHLFQEIQRVRQHGPGPSCAPGITRKGEPKGRSSTRSARGERITVP